MEGKLIYNVVLISGVQPRSLVYTYTHTHTLGFPGGSDSKKCRRPGFNPWVGQIPWRREWQPTPGFLPGAFHRQRSLGSQSMGWQSQT